MRKAPSSTEQGKCSTPALNGRTTRGGTATCNSCDVISAASFLTCNCEVARLTKPAVLTTSSELGSCHNRRTRPCQTSQQTGDLHAFIAYTSSARYLGIFGQNKNSTGTEGEECWELKPKLPEIATAKLWESCAFAKHPPHNPKKAKQKAEEPPKGHNSTCHFEVYLMSLILWRYSEHGF